MIVDTVAKVADPTTGEKLCGVITTTDSTTTVTVTCSSEFIGNQVLIRGANERTNSENHLIINFVSVKAADPANDYDFTSIKKNLQVQVSDVLPLTSLFNEVEFVDDCPIEYSIVDDTDNYNDLLGWQKYAFYLDENNSGKFTIDNSYYEGPDIRLNLKGKTDFQTIYKPIVITEDVTGVAPAVNCMAQSLTPYNLYPYEFKGIRNYAADDPVASVDLLQGFTNADPDNCPIEFTILSEDRTTLHADYQSIFTIDGSSVV